MGLVVIMLIGVCGWGTLHQAVIVCFVLFFTVLLFHVYGGFPLTFTKYPKEYLYQVSNFKCK